MKQCTVCHIEKELDEFEKSARMKDGHRNQCRACRKLYNQSNYKKYYKKHRKDKLAQVKAYNEHNREKKIAYLREYRKRDYAIIASREANRRRRADPKNRPYLAFKVRQYLAVKAAAPGKCSPQQKLDRWDYYEGKCWVCGIDATEFDHVKPLSKGGSNWPGNMRPICKPCNVRKGNKWPYKPTVTKLTA